MANINGQPLKTLNTERMLNKINQGKRRTHRIDVDFSDMGSNFVGTVIVHHPSQMDRLQQGVLKSNLLGGATNVDQMTDNIATIISTLETVIDQKPDWFDVYDDEIDYDIIEGVYLEYIKWINSFRRGTKPVQDTGNSEN